MFAKDHLLLEFVLNHVGTNGTSCGTGKTAQDTASGLVRGEASGTASKDGSTQTSLTILALAVASGVGLRTAILAILLLLEVYVSKIGFNKVGRSLSPGCSHLVGCSPAGRHHRNNLEQT